MIEGKNEVSKGLAKALQALEQGEKITPKQWKGKYSPCKASMTVSAERSQRPPQN